MTIEKQCIECGETKSLAIPDEAYAAWQAGELIQNAMPMVDVYDRELLISSMCGECFHALFAEDDEEEDNERDTLANIGMCEDDFR